MSFLFWPLINRFDFQLRTSVMVWVAPRESGLRLPPDKSHHLQRKQAELAILPKVRSDEGCLRKPIKQRVTVIASRIIEG